MQKAHKAERAGQYLRSMHRRMVRSMEIRVDSRLILARYKGYTNARCILSRSYGHEEIKNVNPFSVQKANKAVRAGKYIPPMQRRIVPSMEIRVHSRLFLPRFKGYTNARLLIPRCYGHEEFKDVNPFSVQKAHKAVRDGQYLRPMQRHIVPSMEIRVHSRLFLPRYKGYTNARLLIPRCYGHEEFKDVNPFSVQKAHKAVRDGQYLRPMQRHIVPSMEIRVHSRLFLPRYKGCTNARWLIPTSYGLKNVNPFSVQKAHKAVRAGQYLRPMQRRIVPSMEIRVHSRLFLPRYKGCTNARWLIPRSYGHEEFKNVNPLSVQKAHIAVRAGRYLRSLHRHIVMSMEIRVHSRLILPRYKGCTKARWLIPRSYGHEEFKNVNPFSVQKAHKVVRAGQYLRPMRRRIVPSMEIRVHSRLYLPLYKGCTNAKWLIPRNYGHEEFKNVNPFSVQKAHKAVRAGQYLRPMQRHMLPSMEIRVHSRLFLPRYKGCTNARWLIPRSYAHEEFKNVNPFSVQKAHKAVRAGQYLCPMQRRIVPSIEIRVHSRLFLRRCKGCTDARCILSRSYGHEVFKNVNPFSVQKAHKAVRAGQYLRPMQRRIVPSIEIRVHSRLFLP